MWGAERATAPQSLRLRGHLLEDPASVESFPTPRVRGLPQGNLMDSVMGAFAEFERSRIRERGQEHPIRPSKHRPI